MRKLLLLCCLALAALPATVSCGKGGEQPGGDETVLTVKVEHDYFSLTVGDKVTVRAKAEPASADLPALTWTSRDPRVATVSDGTIEAVGPGETTVVVSCRQASAQIAVIVKEKEKPGDEGGGGTEPDDLEGPATLFNATPDRKHIFSDFLLNGIAQYTDAGLLVSSPAGMVRLNRFYALAQRRVRYRISAEKDAVCLFQSSEKDITVRLDYRNKKLSILTSPETSVDVPFLLEDKDFDVEVVHDYQKATARLVDAEKKDSAEVSAVNDGGGGYGQGVVNDRPFSVGLGHDYFCFGIDRGAMTVKRVTVEAPRRAVRLLIYGDSITEPEGYYPTSLFPQAWTQLIIKELDGNAISSGRGGYTINEVQNYIRNELPFIKAKYVMVTIGTNGGNTEQNLRELMQFIRNRGAIPILNNIPSNESGTQVSVNEVIGRVRRAMELQGARFDLATSLAGDGKEVDKSMMFWENYPPEIYGGWQVWHHPNEKGSKAMFEQALKDLPELFESAGND